MGSKTIAEFVCNKNNHSIIVVDNSYSPKLAKAPSTLGIFL